MRLTFGMNLDGSEWSPKQASAGEMQVGPQGLLEVLETHMGLTGLHPHHARRIDQYMARLAEGDTADAWYHRSFAKDAWSTAKQLLAWRDELIGAGWDGKAEASDSPRLRTLALAEASQLPLSIGFEDRLIEAMQEMEFWTHLPISEILLTEPREFFPPIWQKVLGLLEERGTDISAAPEVSESNADSNADNNADNNADSNADNNADNNADSNLAAVQRRLRDNTYKTDLQNDDESLLLVEAGDEWEAAEHCARWLGAHVFGAKSDEENTGVTIICSGDSGVLDHALQRYGLPRLGRSESSRWRADLQILPLVLANAWKPLDVRRLVELLTIRPSPILSFAPWILLKALTKQPGTGGEKWLKALDAVAAKYIEKAAEDGKVISGSEAKAYADLLNTYLATDRYDEKEGIPEEKLRERCQWLIDSFGPRMRHEPELKTAVAHAREIQKLSEGKGLIPRVAVERMLDSVIGTGEVEEGRRQEAAPWLVLAHPAQAVQECRTLIWWNFNAEDAPQRTWWSPDEIASLNRHGAALEDAASALSREARGWRRALQSAQERTLLFTTQRFRGEQTWPHALWDEIRVAAKQLSPVKTAAAVNADELVKECLTRQCAGLTKDSSWSLAGRSMPMRIVEPCDSPAAAAQFAIPVQAVPPPDHLSYSSMSDMIGCPMKWTLEHHAKLRRTDAQDLPTTNLMIGLLCHHIVNRLYSESGKQLSPELAAQQASVLFDELVPSMASELLLLGGEVEQLRYREAIARAVQQLVEAIDRLGMTVESSEREIELEDDGLRFKGFVDLILRDNSGTPFVLDLKWSYSTKRYIELVESGSALQLASYAWLIRKADGETGVPFADGAYFLLAKGQLLGASPHLGMDSLDSKLQPEEIWRRGRRSWEANFHEVNRGVMEAAGVAQQLRREEEDLSADAFKKAIMEEQYAKELLYIEPPCRFCNYSALCGKMGEEE
ncbi:MAG: PD-(D/E)XK nuclease family protein [Bacteroidota bacterium]